VNTFCSVEVRLVYVYDVRCTMYDVRCTMYDVRCTMYDEQDSLISCYMDIFDWGLGLKSK